MFGVDCAPCTATSAHYGRHMLTDRYDNELTTTSEQARARYVDGIDRMLAGDGGIGPVLDAAIEADPHFALAHVARARHDHLLGHGREARDRMETAITLAADTTARERRHTEIYAAIISGDIPRSLDLTMEHLAEHPRDAFVVAPASGVFGSIGFSGRIGRFEEQRAFLDPLATHYGNDWWFLTVHAFAIAETGDWERARTLAERALELRPTNAHAAHTLAHVLYEGGADTDALEFLTGFVPDTDRDGILHCHLWWHYALVLMTAGHADAAWDAFTRNCMPDTTTSPAINVFTDASSFLWRAAIAGLECSPAIWEAVRDHYETSFRKPIVFVDCHAALPYAALGDSDKVAATIAVLDELAEQGRLPAGGFGAQVARAYDAFANARWADVIDTLEPMMTELPRIGGSRAQSDLVTNTLLAAYVNDGRTNDAAALLDREHDELGRSVTHPVAGLAA